MYAISVFLLAGLSFGCNSTKFLKSNEFLLDKNTVEIKQKVEDKGDLAYELSTYYRQKPNSNFFTVFPREWQYFKLANREDLNSWQRFKFRSFAEEPAIYNDSLTSISAQDMQTYLKYKGYLRAKVIPQRDPRKQKMRVSYYALPGPLFTIDTVSFNSTDNRVNQLLQEAQEESLFKTGAPLDLSLFAQEKQRITDFMRNNGYAEFYQNQIGDLELDTFQTPHQANIYLNVLPPFGDTVHQQFFIGDIKVFLDYTIDASNIVKDTTIAGLNFILSDRGFIVSPTILRKAISLRPGERYSLSNYNSTNEQLSELGVFRFVRIKTIPDPIQKDLIHFSIQLTPDYLLEFDTALELNYTNRSSGATGNLLGFSLSPSVTHKNLFSGAEFFRMGLSAGVEVAPNNIGDSTFWNTVDLKAQFGLSLPKFVDYLGIWRKLYRLPIGKDNHLLNRNFYRSLQEKGKTNMEAIYEYLLIIDWYRYHSLNLSYGFQLNNSRYEQFAVDHFAINYLIPTTDVTFQIRQADNGFLQRSFGEQLFVSFLLREMDYIRRSKVNRRGRSGYFNANFEIAGAEVLGVNKLYNSFSGDTTTFVLSDSIEISQYIRTEVELRFNKQIDAEQSIVGRFNIAAARPFGFTTDVPYVKQFFVGGANSMRGWAQRGLGPGGYLDPLSLNPDNNFRLFQTGDFKMEMNLEYRFPIALWFKGAVFMDVGNVWTFDKDDERPGSQFLLRRGEDLAEFPFYKQLAVAAGLGLRVDVSYFIFRFDVGAKLRNSFPSYLIDNKSQPESAWWNDFRDISSSDFGFNLGLGMPF